MDPEPCSACLATARGGRIRITHETSTVLSDMLSEHLSSWLLLRRRAIESGHSDMVAEADHQAMLIRQLRGEVARTRQEMGWT